MRLVDEKALARLLATSRVRIAGTHKESLQVARAGRAARPAAVSPKPRSKPVGRSELEQELQRQIEEAELPFALFDAPYLVGSRHRLDVCWPPLRLGIEVQGAIHMARDKWKRDIRKRAESLMQGWTVLEVDRDAIYSKDAIRWITQLIKART